MSTETLIALFIGLFGGGGIWSIIKSFIDEKSGMKRLQKEMQEGFAKTDQKIQALSDRMAEDKAVTARVRILRFSDDIQSGLKHSKESFWQVLQDIDEYEDYCALHERFSNNKTVIATERIKACYKERLEQNDFL